MSLIKSVFNQLGFEVMSLQTNDGIYHLKSTDGWFDGLAIIVFPNTVEEDGFSHVTCHYENGEVVYGETAGVEEPWRLADHLLAVFGNCLKDGVFNYEHAQYLRQRLSSLNANWLYQNEIEECFGTRIDFVGDIEKDGFGRVVSDKQTTPRVGEEGRVRMRATFESGDVAFYY